MEFLIRRSDGDWFDLHTNRFEEVLRPSSFESRPVHGWGDHRIEVRGCPISFSYEDPGIQVCFEGDGLTEAEASQIANEVAASITTATGQSSEVMPL
jgi:hypothetical protein